MPKVNNQDSSVRAVRESRTNDFIHIQALHIKTQCRKKKKNNCFASGDKLVSSLAYDTDDNRAVKRVTNCEVLFFFTYTYTKAISSIHSILRSKINEAERFETVNFIKSSKIDICICPNCANNLMEQILENKLQKIAKKFEPYFYHYVLYHSYIIYFYKSITNIIA